MFEKIDCVVGTFSVSILLKSVADGFVWICTGCMVHLILGIGMLYGQNLIV